MPEYAYDPELPFVVYHSFLERVVARFEDESDAEEFVAGNQYRSVIDTTPKPKIPEGAKIVHWMDCGWPEAAIWHGKNSNKPWAHEGILLSTDELLERIGDRDVTILEPS